jgi:hypothetical protein
MERIFGHLREALDHPKPTQDDNSVREDVGHLGYRDIGQNRIGLGRGATIASAGLNRNKWKPWLRL